jgi:hypothetical protein
MLPLARARAACYGIGVAGQCYALFDRVIREARCPEGQLMTLKTIERAATLFRTVLIPAVREIPELVDIFSSLRRKPPKRVDRRLAHQEGEHLCGSIQWFSPKGFGGIECACCRSLIWFHATNVCDAPLREQLNIRAIERPKLFTPTPVMFEHGGCAPGKTVPQAMRVRRRS